MMHLITSNEADAELSLGEDGPDLTPLGWVVLLLF